MPVSFDRVRVLEACPSCGFWSGRLSTSRCQCAMAISIVHRPEYPISSQSRVSGTGSLVKEGWLLQVSFFVAGCGCAVLKVPLQGGDTDSDRWVWVRLLDDGCGWVVTHGRGRAWVLWSFGPRERGSVGAWVERQAVLGRYCFLPPPYLPLFAPGSKEEAGRRPFVIIKPGPRPTTPLDLRKAASPTLLSLCRAELSSKRGVANSFLDLRLLRKSSPSTYETPFLYLIASTRPSLRRPDIDISSGRPTRPRSARLRTTDYGVDSLSTNNSQHQYRKGEFSLLGCVAFFWLPASRSETRGTEQNQYHHSIAVVFLAFCPAFCLATRDSYLPCRLLISSPHSRGARELSASLRMYARRFLSCRHVYLWCLPVLSVTTHQHSAAPCFLTWAHVTFPTVDLDVLSPSEFLHCETNGPCSICNGIHHSWPLSRVTFVILTVPPSEVSQRRLPRPAESPWQIFRHSPTPDARPHSSNILILVPLACGRTGHERNSVRPRNRTRERSPKTSPSAILGADIRRSLPS